MLNMNDKIRDALYAIETVNALMYATECAFLGREGGLSQEELNMAEYSFYAIWETVKVAMEKLREIAG